MAVMHEKISVPDVAIGPVRLIAEPVNVSMGPEAQSGLQVFSCTVAVPLA